MPVVCFYTTRLGEVGAAQAERGGTSTSSDSGKRWVLQLESVVRSASPRSRRDPRKLEPPGRNAAEPRRGAVSTNTMSATVGNCVARSMFLHATRHREDSATRRSRRQPGGTRRNLDEKRFRQRRRVLQLESVLRVICFYTSRHGEVGATKAERGGTSTRSDFHKNDECYSRKMCCA